MATDFGVGTRVLEALLARSAGVLHIGIVGSEAGLDKAVVASYRCYLKNTDVMIAAIPLEMAQQDRSIRRGANVFDFAVQGHYSGDMQLRQRNFEYIFGMGPKRAAEHASSLTDPVQKEQIVSMTNRWLGAIKDLPANDLKGAETDMLVFDEVFDNVIRVRVLRSDGTAESTNIKLVSSATAQWLANYLL